MYLGNSNSVTALGFKIGPKSFKNELSFGTVKETYDKCYIQGKEHII